MASKHARALRFANNSDWRPLMAAELFVLAFGVRYDTYSSGTNTVLVTVLTICAAGAGFFVSAFNAIQIDIAQI